MILGEQDLKRCLIVFNDYLKNHKNDKEEDLKDIKRLRSMYSFYSNLELNEKDIRINREVFNEYININNKKVDDDFMTGVKMLDGLFMVHLTKFDYEKL